MLGLRWDVFRRGNGWRAHDISFFSSLPAWGTCLSLAVHLAAGIVVEYLFSSLWWNARRFTAGDRTATTIAVMIGRFRLLGWS